MTILKSIRSATIGATDVKATAASYVDMMDYTIAEETTVSAGLASAWGLPDMAGRAMITLEPASKLDTYIRAVEIDPVAGYVPMATYGWNAIEIICDDTDAVFARFDGSPFKVVGEPRNLKGYESIRASQYVGLGKEIVYLTCETGDRSTSLLPLPQTSIGRVFIMVVSSADVESLIQFYRDSFAMEADSASETEVDIVNAAQGLPDGSPMMLGFAPIQEPGFFIEFDGYNADSSGPRPFTAGQLWPGVAMTSFTVDSLEAVKAPFVTDPQSLSGLGYDGAQVACVHGPNGELIELIQA